MMVVYLDSGMSYTSYLFIQLYNTLHKIVCHILCIPLDLGEMSPTFVFEM